MAIEKLDETICTGCGICFDVCPEDVFRMDESTGKALIKYPEDCAACWSCELFCPVNCIEVSEPPAREMPSPY